MGIEDVYFYQHVLYINLDEAYGSLITLSAGNSTISSSIYPGVLIFIKDGSSLAIILVFISSKGHILYFILF